MKGGNKNVREKELYQGKEVGNKRVAEERRGEEGRWAENLFRKTPGQTCHITTQL